MAKYFLMKTSIGKPQNEMDNCPFASALVAPLSTTNGSSSSLCKHGKSPKAACTLKTSLLFYSF